MLCVTLTHAEGGGRGSGGTGAGSDAPSSLGWVTLCFVHFISFLMQVEEGEALEAEVLELMHQALEAACEGGTKRPLSLQVCRGVK